MSELPRPTPATPEALAAFLDTARKACPDEHIGAKARPRCIGFNHQTVNNILAVVQSGAKTGTFSPVWLHEKKPETRPTIAELMALCDYDGNPKILLQIVGLDLVKWRDIGSEHTKLDGPAVRALDVWKPMHWKLWSGQLAELGVTAAEDMPICVERFRVIYPKTP